MSNKVTKRLKKACKKLSRRFIEAFATGLTPDPIIDYDIWCDENLYLGDDTSNEPGKFRISRTPFMVDVLKALSPSSPAKLVTLVKPTQTGGTTILLCWVCATIAVNPRSILLIFVTADKATDFSTERFQATVDATPLLREKLAKFKSRTGANTIARKKFRGGIIRMLGSNSEASYRQGSYANVGADDFSGYKANISGQGSPDLLLGRRTGSIGDAKIYLNSSITNINDLIDVNYKNGSRGKYCFRCKTCGEYQYPEWGRRDGTYGIKFTRDKNGEIIDIWYQCKFCAGRIEEHEREYKWIHERPELIGRRPSFKYNILVTPVGWPNTWKVVAEEFLQAVREKKEGRPSRYITWLTTFMCEPWDGGGEKPDASKIQARAENYSPWIVQPGVQLLTAGIDWHPDRFEVSIYGWGYKQEAWLIYTCKLWGNTALKETQVRLDELIYRDYKDKKGHTYRIQAAGVDTGDGNTNEASQAYCRERGPIVYALRGSSTSWQKTGVVAPPSYLDYDYTGGKITGGLMLWQVGTEQAKTDMYTSLKSVALSPHGSSPGYIHFYAGIPEVFYDELVSERLVMSVDSSGYAHYKYEKGDCENHTLDCLVYAYHAAIKSGARELKEIIFEETEKDVFEPVCERVTHTQRPQTHKRKTGGNKKYVKPTWLKHNT